MMAGLVEGLIISERAKKAIELFGGIENAAKAIKRSEVRNYNGREYTVGEDLRFLRWPEGYDWGPGEKTALEIAALCVSAGLVTIDECKFKNTELRMRIFFNQKCKEFGHNGPFLMEERKGSNSKLIGLRARRENLLAKLKRIDAEIEELSEKEKGAK